MQERKQEVQNMSSKGLYFGWENNGKAGGKMTDCKRCENQSDGVPDCVIDGVCPLTIEKKKQEGK